MPRKHPGYPNSMTASERSQNASMGCHHFHPTAHVRCALPLGHAGDCSNYMGSWTPLPEMKHGVDHRLFGACPECGADPGGPCWSALGTGYAGHVHASRPSLPPRPHGHDTDCTVDPATGCCTSCGIGHGDPCPDCGQRAFHLPLCRSLYILSISPLLTRLRDIRKAADTARSNAQVDRLVRDAWQAQRTLLSIRADHYGYSYDLSWLDQQLEARS